MVSTEYLTKEINFEDSNKKLLEDIINFGLNLGADFVEIFLEGLFLMLNFIDIFNIYVL